MKGFRRHTVASLRSLNNSVLNLSQVDCNALKKLLNMLLNIYILWNTKHKVVKSVLFLEDHLIHVKIVKN